MIEWLIQRVVDSPLAAADFRQGITPPEGLLSASESAVYDGLHIAKRRQDWLLGRWTAKRLVQAAMEKSGANSSPYCEIAILAARDGAPQIWLGEEERFTSSDLNISISHSDGVAFCAVAPKAYQLGADIEMIEARSERFVEDYFTGDEAEAVRQTPVESRDRLITAIWSGKESALKAVRQGLRLDTRTVCCRFPSPLPPPRDGKESQHWDPFSVEWRGPEKQIGYPELAGWWRVWQGFVLTLVVAREPKYAFAHEGIEFSSFREQAGLKAAYQ